MHNSTRHYHWTEHRQIDFGSTEDEQLGGEVPKRNEVCEQGHVIYTTVIELGTTGRQGIRTLCCGCYRRHIPAQRQRSTSTLRTCVPAVQ